MKNRKKVSVISGMAILALILMPLSGQEEASEGDMKDTKKADKVVTISMDNASPFNNGEFQGWGSSFCWWANRLGYSDSLAKQVAELFYSKEQGLGLNIIRYNIGGGDDPTHEHITRTDSMIPGYWKDGTEGFVNGEYTWEYDWSKDSNQRNALMKCVEEYGDGIIVEAFSNSPPYFMTESGCSSGSVSPSEDNLKKDAYNAFAKYMAQVSAHFRDEWGITFQSITPMNEPYTSYWNAGSWKQEGCHFDQGSSQSDIIEALQEAMEAEGFGDIVYSGTDETDIETQIASYEKLSDKAKEIVTRIDGHTYSGSKYRELKKTALEGGENLWMSEVDGGETEGENAGEMGAALYFANKIIRDMNGMTPSAWIMWQIIDNHICEEGYNGREDYGMPNTEGGYWGIAVADHDNDNIVLTKKYYAFGQFTKYIRPGYTIIASSDSSLAALDKENGRLVIVATNAEAKDITCDFDLRMFETVGTSVEMIRTSGDMETGENWAQLDPISTYGKGFVAPLKGNSITTFIVEGVTGFQNELEEIAVSEENVEEGSDFLVVDLGGLYSLDAIRCAPKMGKEAGCVDAVISGSADGENWEQLYVFSEKPAAELTYITNHAWECNEPLRYVRIQKEGRSAIKSAAQWSFYGKNEKNGLLSGLFK